MNLYGRGYVNKGGKGSGLGQKKRTPRGGGDCFRPGAKLMKKPDRKKKGGPKKTAGPGLAARKDTYHP